MVAMAQLKILEDRNQRETEVLNMKSLVSRFSGRRFVQLFTIVNQCLFDISEPAERGLTLSRFTCCEIEIERTRL